MSKLEIALTSPVFWTMAGTFIYAGLSAIAPQLPHATFVAFILAGLGMLLHPSEIIKAGSTQ